ncbi:hypothetical protein C8J56DRAFT_889333 [Mycena floridula]|nr:hypothetical protein C8J56DRAFT_889333 [Mycena floridula]
MQSPSKQAFERSNSSNGSGSALAKSEEHRWPIDCGSMITYAHSVISTVTLTLEAGVLPGYSILPVLLGYSGVLCNCRSFRTKGENVDPPHVTPPTSSPPPLLTFAIAALKISAYNISAPDIEACRKFRTSAEKSPSVV